MAISSGAVVAVLSLFCCYSALGGGGKEGDILTNMCTNYDPLGIVLRKVKVKGKIAPVLN
jgi:hypothetical protein